MNPVKKFDFLNTRKTLDPNCPSRAGAGAGGPSRLPLSRWPQVILALPHIDINFSQDRSFR